MRNYAESSDPGSGHAAAVEQVGAFLSPALALWPLAPRKVGQGAAVQAAASPRQRAPNNGRDYCSAKVGRSVPLAAMIFHTPSDISAFLFIGVLPIRCSVLARMPRMGTVVPRFLIYDARFPTRSTAPPIAGSRLRGMHGKRV